VQVSGDIEVATSPDRVVAFLSHPRNLIAANHKGPVVERSEGPLASGSWFVLAFDQLRARVEYVTYEPPTRISAYVSLSGLGSGGARWRHDYVLTPKGTGTHVAVAVDGRDGLIRWAPFQRAVTRLALRRLKAKIEASAPDGSN
jgi:carbon monoxide dehydrogenase subunit G